VGVVGVELVVGYLIAWVLRKGRRIGGRLDGEADQVLDAGLDRLHDVVARKLGSEPALSDLHEEASGDRHEVSTLTRQRVGLAIQAATAKDGDFAGVLAQALESLKAAESTRAAVVSASGDQSASVGGNVNIQAEGGSVAGFSIGDVRINPPPVDPWQPGRSSD